MARRTASGDLGTSAPQYLWQQTTELLQRYRVEAERLHVEVNALHKEIQALREETIALKEQAAALRMESAVLKRRLRTVGAQLDQDQDG